MKFYEVKALNKIDPTRYKEGDIFKTKRTVAMLVNGKLQHLNFDKVNLKDYIKKEDLDTYLKEHYPRFFKEENNE